MTAKPVLTLVVIAWACAGESRALELRQPRPVAADSAAVRAQWSSALAGGSWRLRLTQRDAEFPGRTHQRYAQTVNGVPIFGAEIVRQLDAGGTTRTVFGSVHENVAVDTRPELTPDEARHVVDAAMPGSRAVGQAELLVLPLDGGAFLAYSLRAFRMSPPSLMRYFVDARSGAVLFSYEDIKRAVPVVGTGTGTWGDRKKIATRDYGGRFLAEDGLRPAPITTYDLHYSVFQIEAEDADNVWTDGMVVDAHSYAGMVYDYLKLRQGRNGIDDANSPVASYVHVFPRNTDAGLNAFWADAIGMIYGDGGVLDGVTYAPFSAAIDVAGHEMMHGVTTDTWNGAYLGESGALNESFSDIFATAVEFFAQPPGNGRLMADYWLGEDLSDPFDPARYAFRSMAEPSLFSNRLTGPYPDHYSRRYVAPPDEAHDYGGVHINSGISNQAFYLLVEGGRNRTSGQSVAGLGSVNRQKAEKIFFRGFTLYLTPSATFGDARRATVQAALDLHGANSTEVQQVQAAWSAVGVE